MSIEVGRLAMRVEGDMWNAYYAPPNSMEEAIHLGGIAMAAITGNFERKMTFMGLMQEFIADILQESTGVRPDWTDPVPAPEHERAGRA